MVKLGKGIAFILILTGIMTISHAASANDVDHFNWLPLLSTSMSKLQPDINCPQNQINGASVNKSEGEINAIIREVTWDINCGSDKIKNKPTASLTEQNTKVAHLFTQLSKIPPFNLDVKRINLTAHLFKKVFTTAVVIEKLDSKLVMTVNNELFVAKAIVDLQSKKLTIDGLFALDKLPQYMLLNEEQRKYLHNQLVFQYQSDLKQWQKGRFTVNWKGGIIDFSEHVELSFSGDVNLFEKQLTVSHLVVNAKQVIIPLSEKQSWKTAYIKLKLSDPAVINVSPLQIEVLPIQLRIGTSYLLTKVARGKSKRIRLDKQKIPPLFLQLAVNGNEYKLLVDWKIALLNQRLFGQLLIDPNVIRLTLSENVIDLKPLMESLGNYIDSLQLVEIEKGTLKIDFLTEYSRSNRSVIFNSSVASQEISGKNGDISFDGMHIDSNLHYLIDAQKNMSVIEDKQSIKVDNLFVGIPVQALQIEAKLDAGKPVIQHFKARLLGGRLDFDDFKLNAPSYTILNIAGISLAELIKYSAYPEIQGKGIIDGMLPLTLSHDGPEVTEGIVFARQPGGYIKVPENTVIKAMGSSNPAVSFTLQLLSDFHFNTLEGRIGYTSNGESDLKVEIKGTSPTVSGVQPVNFNYSHNENILKLLKTLRFSEELVRDIKERY